MEVHQHAHTPRKKWTHYFWEFLMLFLAVFAGFLAENQREHYIEHKREKQFIRSLINDVQGDTASLGRLIAERDIRERRLDSLTLLLNSDSADQVTNEIYFLSITIPRVTHLHFISNDGTMQQLKNSGSLRLIRNRAVIDSITKYDAAIRTIQRLDDQEQAIINIYREVGPLIFNGMELGKWSDANNNPLRLERNPPLEKNYGQHLNEFNYRLVSVKNVNKGYRREARKLQQQSENFLRTLKEEYHMD